MVYSRSKKFLYIHIYKTAGTSLRAVLDCYASAPWSYTMNRSRVLQRFDRWGVHLPTRYGQVVGKHLKLHEARVLLGDRRMSDLWSFTFVRNTWDWLVSIYHYILKDRYHPDHAYVSSLGSFEKFIEWYITEGKYEFQSDFILNEDGAVGVDYVARFDNLAEECLFIGERLGLPLSTLPHHNVSSRLRDYRSYYSDALVARVEGVFKADIDRFAFRFDS